jgi:hypothetical protein
MINNDIIINIATIRIIKEKEIIPTAITLIINLN